MRRLSAVSPVFASLWAAHNVGQPGIRVKIFRHPVVGEVRLTTSTFTPSTTPETRLVVYSPRDETTRARLAQLLGTVPR